MLSKNRHAGLVCIDESPVSRSSRIARISAGVLPPSWADANGSSRPPDFTNASAKIHSAGSSCPIDCSNSFVARSTASFRTSSSNETSLSPSISQSLGFLAPSSIATASRADLPKNFPKLRSFAIFPNTAKPCSQNAATSQLQFVSNATPPPSSQNVASTSSPNTSALTRISSSPSSISPFTFGTKRPPSPFTSSSNRSTQPPSAKNFSNTAIINRP